MNESPNDFFIRLIAHNEVQENIRIEAENKEASRIKQVEAIERARNFS
jgi:hypothetical protein